MFEQWNFIIFGRQKLTTLMGRLLRPIFDTIIKENKSTYNDNKFCHFTEKVNNIALITVWIIVKAIENVNFVEHLCSPRLYCVMRVLFESVVYRRVWRYQRDNHWSRKYTSMADYCLSFLFCSIVVCPSSINRFWLPLSYLQTLLVIYQSITAGCLWHDNGTTGNGNGNKSK